MLNSGYHFKIADPNSPCVVTVAMFYGKGYFVLRTSLLCGVTLNMSIEFGAGVELHPWKLASLSASISAGIHFELNTDNVVRLVGYFSCHGSLHVLGVGFNVGLDAAFELINGYILHVYVNLHVETDLLFFSIGVDVPVEFSFAGRPLSGGSLQHGLALPLRQHFGANVGTRTARRSRTTKRPKPTQHIRWTLLRGEIRDGKLCLSVYVSPRLSNPADQSDLKLVAYHDFLNWTETVPSRVRGITNLWDKIFIPTGVSVSKSAPTIRSTPGVATYRRGESSASPGAYACLERGRPDIRAGCPGHWPQLHLSADPNPHRRNSEGPVGSSQRLDQGVRLRTAGTRAGLHAVTMAHRTGAARHPGRSPSEPRLNLLRRKPWRSSTTSWPCRAPTRDLCNRD